MLRIIGAVILIIFGVVFLLSAVIMSQNLKRVRSARSGKLLKQRRRHMTILSALSLALGVTLILSYVLPAYRLGRLKAGGYDLAQTYKTVLENGGQDRAYLYLPTEIVPYGDSFAVKNGRNEWFSYETVETAPDETEQRWLFQCNRTLRAAKITLSGETMLEIQLGEDGRLYVSGSFPYMTYDSIRKTYSGTLARHVSDFYCTGNSLYYLTDDNRLYALGYNEYGQLGDSTNRNKTSPVLIREDVVALAGSETHALFVDHFGNLYAAGDNSDSELGTGTMVNSATPQKIMGGVQSVAAGSFFSVILAQNGDVYTCGRSDNGQCGNGTRNGTAVPVKIGEGARKVVACGDAAAYMTEDGKVLAWGKNDDHCLAEDDAAYLNTPTLVAENAYDIAMGRRMLAVLTRTRSVTVTGRLRTDTGALLQNILELDAAVPDEFVSPYTETEKPDINDLGQE